MLPASTCYPGLYFTSSLSAWGWDLLLAVTISLHLLLSIPLQIVAVILCDTGIALLAYMDGITESRTLGGVVLATLAAAGYAVFRVSFLIPFACCVCFAVAAADVVPWILGNVPQGDGWSAGGPNRIHVYRPRPAQRSAAVACRLSAVPDGCRELNFG